MACNHRCLSQSGTPPHICSLSSSPLVCTPTSCVPGNPPFYTTRWQPTPVFLPGESQGWVSLVGCHLCGRTESDTTEVTQQQQQQQLLTTAVVLSPIFSILQAHDCLPSSQARVINFFPVSNPFLREEDTLQLHFILLKTAGLEKREIKSEKDIKGGTHLLIAEVLCCTSSF